MKINRYPLVLTVALAAALTACAPQSPETATPTSQEQPPAQSAPQPEPVSSIGVPQELSPPVSPALTSDVPKPQSLDANPVSGETRTVTQKQFTEQYGEYAVQWLKANKKNPLAAKWNTTKIDATYYYDPTTEYSGYAEDLILKEQKSLACEQVNDKGVATCYEQTGDGTWIKYINVSQPITYKDKALEPASYVLLGSYDASGCGSDRTMHNTTITTEPDGTVVMNAQIDVDDKELADGSITRISHREVTFRFSDDGFASYAADVLEDGNTIPVFSSTAAPTSQQIIDFPLEWDYIVDYAKQNQPSAAPKPTSTSKP